MTHPASCPQCAQPFVYRYVEQTTCPPDCKVAEHRHTPTSFHVGYQCGHKFKRVNDGPWMPISNLRLA
jgi:hypothetical protein